MTDIVVKSNKDSLLWSVIFGLLAIAIIADRYFHEVSWSIRLTLWLVFGCGLVVIAFQTSQGKKFWQFAKEARIELRKIVWPKREETVRMTFMVIGLVILASLIIWGVDTLLLSIIHLFTGARG